MSKYALMLATALLLSQAPPVRAQAPAKADGAVAANASEAANHVVGYTAWDDDFLYVAVQINKPTLSGRNALPFSNPLEDDAVIIGIQTDNDHKANKPTLRTVLVAASAAGGAQLYAGPTRTPLFNGLSDLQKRIADINNNKALTPALQNTARTALFAQVLKFVVNPKGAQRAGGSFSPGYTLEVAIPWIDLGGKPAPGTSMGFNVAAQSIVAGSPPMQSLSTLVRTPEDAQNPSLWGEIQFSNTGLPARPALIFSPRLFSNKPVIDGDIARGEWNSQAGFIFGAEGGAEAAVASVQRTQDARLRPAFAPQPARPALPLYRVSTEPQPVSAHHPQTLSHLIMARYAYHYQADPRKAAPVMGVTRGNGSTALAHHPLEGVGPWFSYDRADWHRGQLRELRRAGIDVILPEYRGDARSRQTYADKGLRVLVSALQTLRQTNQDYPLVALYLDTTSLTEMFGGDRPDLKQPVVQAALYGMIRDFYQTVPAPFRSQVTLARNAGSGGGIAYPIFLSSAGAFKDVDNAFVDYVRGRFAQDFGGADLLVLGGSDFKGKAALDGYFTETKEKGFQFDNSGWIKTASVGAGYDASFQEVSPGEGAASAVPFLPRRNGDTLRQNWKATIAQKPDWVLLDGWNDYDVGAEVAPTLETGYSAADITRQYARMYMGLVKRNVKFLWHNAPATMLAGRTYTVGIRAQNTGVEPWTTETPVGKNAVASGVPVAWAYRWLRNGALAGTGAATPLTDTVLGGQNVNGEISVTTTGLAPGAYTLEIRAAEAQKKGASEAGLGDGGPGSVLQAPVTVTDGADAKVLPPYAAGVMSDDLPQFLETGSAYTANVTLRNEGTQTWRKAEGARVTLRLYRVAPPEAAEDTKSAQSVPREMLVVMPDTTAELAGDVAPGQTTTVRIVVPIVDTEGKPLPVWKQDDLWTYAARWEVAEGKTDAPPVGTVTPAQPISIVELDFGARFLSDSTPPVLPAERRLPVRMSLQNNGPQIWKKDQVRIGYHWYYQDGSELLWEDETTPITQDVAPGKTLTDTIVWVTAPPFDGTYTLVWDVKVGDTWASTLAATRPFENVTRSVQVRSGRLSFADLSKQFNLDGIADEDSPADGDIDGQGHTLPASLLPPFATGAIVPSGMWLPAERTGPDSPHRISFRWGDKDLKSKNFIACKGQRVELGKANGRVATLHILAASTGKDAVSSLKLIFQEPTSQSEDLYSFLVSRWDQPPTHGEEVAYLSRRLQTPTGAQSNAVALYHYAIKIKEPRNLVALQLPNAPDIKIAAITLEK
jgi:hypothetical protein